jgi:NAD kinase
MALTPRAVVVHRHTELEELLARHGTRQQAAFFLATRHRSIEDVELRHELQQAALRQTSAAIPVDWRRGMVERSELSRFVFSPEDIVIAVGQDGLVANVAKYLSGQPVYGVNPDPDRNPGVLVPHHPAQLHEMLRALVGGTAPTVAQHCMVEAVVDDGQRLTALNEIFVGHRSHQSARYTITDTDGRAERQSSSGVVISTGTGATGWCRSIWLEHRSNLELPTPTQQQLCWFVREAWPSPATGISCTEGTLAGPAMLRITAENDLVIFGDGIESDAIDLGANQTVELRVASTTLALVR